MEFLLNGLEGIKKSKELIQMLTEELQKEIDRQRENPEYQYEWAEEDKECIRTEQEELDAAILSVKEWWEEYQAWKSKKTGGMLEKILRNEHLMNELTTSRMVEYIPKSFRN